MTSMKRVCQAVLLSLVLGAGVAPSYAVPAVRTVVRDDAIVKVTRGERRLRTRKGWSMDGLFIMLREALTEADSVDVQFTRRGVPTTIAIDPEKSVADEETYYSVALSRR